MNKPEILFEDKYLLVVNKPAGILSYPLPKSEEKTIGDIVGALPVHRLDRDTSGVMILAKDKNTKALMQKQFAERKIEKEYISLVWGKVEPEKGEIKIPLGRGSKDRLKIVPSSSGRESHTVYRVVSYFPGSNLSLVELDLKTGRTHQIRVHMSAIGHPVVGDKKYSNKNTELQRQFLHAQKIIFSHPITKKEVIVKSKLPNDLNLFLKNVK